MALYQLKISYDGTEFHGYQRQCEHRTVQGELENALKSIGWKEKSLISSGRTDAGVHADGQIAVINIDWKHSIQAMQRAINAALPGDVVIKDVQEIVSSELHPRYDATARVYRYQIYCSEIRDPIKDRYYWQIWPRPDFSEMVETAQLLTGSHDFRLFGKPYHEGGRTERIVTSAQWTLVENNEMIFKMEANSFLYHMVRRIVFVLILAGQGKITREQVAKQIEGIDNLPPGIAPANGLFLEEIKY